MTMPTTIDEYREHLAQIGESTDLDAHSLGAVFRGWVAGDSFEGEDGPTVGTIVSLRHTLGMGLFGLTTYTFVKLCTLCAHQPSEACPSPEDIEEQQVIALRAVERNGDGAPISSRAGDS
jgi:hypothetical protein